MTNKTLYLAVVLSTGLHLAVLLPLVSHQQTILIDSPPQPMRSMALIVTAESPSQKTKTPDKTIAEQPITNVERKSTRIVQKAKQPASSKNIAIEQQTKKNASEQATTTSSSIDPIALLEHDMLTYLHSEFRVRFQYPLLARKRGWSGEVVIALNVDHNGMIDYIAVKKSSGYPLLDNNAMDTFREIGLMTPAIQSRINNRHQLSIPVIYQLTGG